MAQAGGLFPLAFPSDEVWARAGVLQGSSEVFADLAAGFCLHISLLTLHLGKGHQ